MERFSWDFHVRDDSAPPQTHTLGSKPSSSWQVSGLPERAFSRSWGPVPSPKTRWRKGSGSLQTPGTTRANEDGEIRTPGRGRDDPTGPPQPEGPGPAGRAARTCSRRLGLVRAPPGGPLPVSCPQNQLRGTNLTPGRAWPSHVASEPCGDAGAVGHPRPQPPSRPRLQPLG